MLTAIRGAAAGTSRRLVAQSTFNSVRTFSVSAFVGEKASVPANKEGQLPLATRPDGALPLAGVVSGAPDEIHRRPVRIYRPSAPSTQSAKGTSHHWRIDWDILQGAGRWENPLMGWASSADYMQGTHIKFKTKEDAIHFCEKQGYGYYVQEPHKAKFKPKAYALNYLYRPGKLRIIHTK
ncbi:hypothetical protein T439DRAFT_298709 [Meredithblackwellia eburnea MCA 4105]